MAWARGEVYHPPAQKKGFSGEAWDAWPPSPPLWTECLRVLKPGGYLLNFAGTRTYGLMQLSMMLGGANIVDSIGYTHDDSEKELQGGGLMAWVKATAIAQGTDIGGALSVAMSDTPNDYRIVQYRGFNTRLKPMWEPIILAQKPLAQIDCSQLAARGVRFWCSSKAPELGAVLLQESGIDIPAQAWRVLLKKATAPPDETHYVLQLETDEGFADVETFGHSPFYPWVTSGVAANVVCWGTGGMNIGESRAESGRWPANVIIDDSETVAGLFPEAGNGWQRNYGSTDYKGRQYAGSMFGGGGYTGDNTYADEGSAARFFYCARASTSEKNKGMPKGMKNSHKTVKPIALMRYLCRLVTPHHGTILDPFMGSGSTGVAALLEGFSFVGIDNNDTHYTEATHRLAWAQMTYEHNAHL
jgi:hypothetical protein